MPYMVNSYCTQCQQGDRFSIGHWNTYKGVFVCQTCRAIVNIPLETGQCPGCGYTPANSEFFDYSGAIAIKNITEPPSQPMPTCPKCLQAQLNFGIAGHMNMGAAIDLNGLAKGQDYLEKAIFAYNVLLICGELGLDPVEVFHYFNLDIPKTLMEERKAAAAILNDLRIHLQIRYMNDISDLEAKWLAERERVEHPYVIYSCAIAVARQWQLKRFEAISLLGLGLCCEQMRRYEQANALYQQALSFFYLLKDTKTELFLLTLLSEHYARLGQDALAWQTIQHALSKL
ncbi:MAG: tetratricopeptide repeat protein, partial [Anaerolineae bacterium]|nr:tetratricopeptide repeat protein [Anaerolineae bacterium]